MGGLFTGTLIVADALGYIAFESPDSAAQTALCCSAADVGVAIGISFVINNMENINNMEKESKDEWVVIQMPND